MRRLRVVLTNEPLTVDQREVMGSRRMITVFSSGRSLEAEIVRSMLESYGVEAFVWGSGLGVWRAESALTELTGVPNDFSSYRVVVPHEHAEEAEALIAASDESHLDSAGPTSLLQSRWMVVGFAILFLILVLTIGTD